MTAERATIQRLEELSATRIPKKLNMGLCGEKSVTLCPNKVFTSNSSFLLLHRPILSPSEVEF